MFTQLSKKLKDSEKDFDNLLINNTVIEELPANCFGDIYFQNIMIENTSNLKRIDLNAFSGTDVYTQRFILINSPKLENSPKTLIFDILNKFAKLEAITLNGIGLSEIPANAFKTD